MVTSILIPIVTEAAGSAILHASFGSNQVPWAAYLKRSYLQAASMLWLFSICILIAFLAALLLVPTGRSLAHLLGIVDHPDSDRKLHTAPIALGGGIAVFAAFAIAFFATILIDRQFFGGLLGDVTNQWYVLFASAIAILLVGFIDDVWALRGRQKLLLQCLIIAAMVGSGTVIDQIGLFGIDVPLGVFAYPISILWLLIAVNALNLIDGADGVATTAGSIICVGFGALSVLSNDPLNATVGFAIAAALLGFLIFNRPPATIYLGDSGSMMIGLFIGVLAVWSNVKESTVLSAAPVAILAIPLFDSTAAILRRWLTGRSIYAADRAHLHHLLREKYGPIGMLYVIAAVCFTTTSLAVLSVYLKQPWLSAVGVMAAVGFLIFTRSFGHAEATLVIGRAAHFARSLTMPPEFRHSEKHHRCVSLQGNGPWDTIWEPLVNFAESRGFAGVKIDLNMSWLHEGYHANWQSIRLPEKDTSIRLQVPLFASRAGIEVQIGRLELIAPAIDARSYDAISEISDHLVDLVPQISRIVADLESATALREGRQTGSLVTASESACNGAC